MHNPDTLQFDLGATRAGTHRRGGRFQPGDRKNLTMIGAGYVGLVTGACLAAIGHKVTVIDRDPKRIEMLRAGRMPIHENGLEALVRDAVQAKRLSFSEEVCPAVALSDAVFICVGTPPHPTDGHADLSFVRAAVREIAAGLSHFTLIVIKSTVPVGTGDEVEDIIRKVRPEADFAVASNPEFLREGVAIEDFLHPDRIVIGTDDERARAIMAAIYRPITAEGHPLVMTGRRTSELIKYAANCFLAIKINYINEIANLCEEVGADVEEVSHGIGLDTRIGAKFLNAGPGFGGSCFPKDMMALIKTAQDHGMPLRSVETAVAVNDSRKGEMVRKIVRAAGGSIDGKTVAVWGLTFKAGTDDMRSASSLVILPQLIKAGATVRAYDPAGMEQAKAMMPTVVMTESPLDAAASADVLVLLTEWPIFRKVDLGILRSVVNAPVIVDLRNEFDPLTIEEAGFRYVSVGRAAPIMRPTVTVDAPFAQTGTS